MKAAELDVEATIAHARKTLDANPSLSPEIRAVLEMLMLVVQVMFRRLSLTSRNSGKPPSTDQKGKAKSRSLRTGLRPGGQPGHPGATLQPVPEPDEITDLRPTSCAGCAKGLSKRGSGGFEARQVFDVKLAVVATEYRAHEVGCACGRRNFGAFPAGVDGRVGYGAGVKSLAVYHSQFQLMPYKRVEDMFRDQFGLPVGAGSVANFNAEAFGPLEAFENDAKAALAGGPVLHVDETGVRIANKTCWLHSASNDLYTLLAPHATRGTEAMDEIGVLPAFRGVMVHDHWKPYFTYGMATHALCNAHHLRELVELWEFDRPTWAWSMKNLLANANDFKDANGGEVSAKQQAYYQKRDREILRKGRAESPLTPKPGGGFERKKTKARCLLDRLREFEAETLRFMREPAVPFTNNEAERSFRMAKVQQKVSGCFRSMAGALVFGRVRSFCLSAQKHGTSPGAALDRLMRAGYAGCMAK